MFNFIRNHKAISVIGAINIAVVITVIVVIIIHSTKTATVDIYVAPSSAEITLNGQKYDNLKTHNIAPGEYHVKITMDNMQTEEYDITLETNGFTRVNDYLLDSRGGFDYYLTHPDDVVILTEIAEEDDKKIQSFLSKYEKMASILKALPIKYDSYTEDFSDYIQYNIRQDDRRDCDKVACLIIEDNTGDNKQRAIDKLKELGYNPDDYNITYQYVPLYTSGMNNE